MTEIQCPICKSEFRTDMDIFVRIYGLVVFRSRMVYLSRLRDTNSLLDFIRNALNQKPKLRKKELINHLIEGSRIPKYDAIYIVEQLLKEGVLSEDDGCLFFNG